MIVVVDYRMGNVGSILNMLRRAGAAATISADPETIRSADRLILPGVGSFDAGMAQLARTGLLPVLNEQVLGRGTPVLGICLGMQLLTRGSEEGSAAGLGWIAADTVRFRFAGNERALKIPHMGWNTVSFAPGSPVGAGLVDPRFYFVHSYHVRCDRDETVVGRTSYGYEFASVVAAGTIVGVQFHPEKSHRFGLALLKGFADGFPAPC